MDKMNLDNTMKPSKTPEHIYISSDKLSGDGYVWKWPFEPIKRHCSPNCFLLSVNYESNESQIQDPTIGTTESNPIKISDSFSKQDMDILNKVMTATMTTEVHKLIWCIWNYNHLMNDVATFPTYPPKSVLELVHFLGVFPFNMLWYMKENKTNGWLVCNTVYFLSFEPKIENLMRSFTLFNLYINDYSVVEQIIIPFLRRSSSITCNEWALEEIRSSLESYLPQICKCAHLVIVDSENVLNDFTKQIFVKHLSRFCLFWFQSTIFEELMCNFSIHVLASLIQVCRNSATIATLNRSIKLLMIHLEHVKENNVIVLYYAPYMFPIHEILKQNIQFVESYKHLIDDFCNPESWNIDKLMSCFAKLVPLAHRIELYKQIHFLEHESLYKIIFCLYRIFVEKSQRFPKKNSIINFDKSMSDVCFVFMKIFQYEKVLIPLLLPIFFRDIITSYYAGDLDFSDTFEQCILDVESAMLLSNRCVNPIYAKQIIRCICTCMLILKSKPKHVAIHFRLMAWLKYKPSDNPNITWPDWLLDPLNEKYLNLFIFTSLCTKNMFMLLLVMDHDRERTMKILNNIKNQYQSEILASLPALSNMNYIDLTMCRTEVLSSLEHIL